MDSTSPGLALIQAGRRPVRSIASGLTCCGILVLGLFPGCMTESASYQVPAPPPPAPLGQQATSPTPVVANAPESVAFSPLDQAETTIIVTQVPRFPQQEAVLDPPSHRHVWLAGYWTWRSDRYEWIAGHWEQPPGTSLLWVRPRWVHAGGSYRFYEGYWW